MAYKKEKVIEISSWIVMSLMLLTLIPKSKLREAHVAFLFKQVVTWLMGLIIVEKNMINYPFRTFFKKSIKSSFTFEYFVFPGLNVLFNIYYPERRNNGIKVLYYFIHSSAITFLELIALKYTKLIKYKNWNWYWSFLSIWICYYVSRRYQKWFFTDPKSI
jgi:hypothetical protein